MIANPITGSPISVNPIANGSSCHTPFNYGSSSPISVLVISSGSTGRICVEYSNTFHNLISDPSYISVYQYNSSGSYGVCPGCSLNTVTSLFELSASPDTVTFPGADSPNSQREMVEYTLSVPTNVKSGIFGISLFQFCSLFPMVVVSNSGTQAELTRSEFSSWYPHVGSCPAQLLSRNLLGVAGFQVVTLASNPSELQSS